MQNISLGDYKGGRDTLQTTLGQQYQPLNDIMGAAAAYAKEGLGNIGSRELYRQHDAATLHAALTQKTLENQLANQDLLQKYAMRLSDEGEVISGEEEAMLAHNRRVIGMMSPEDQRKFAPYIQSLSDAMGTGSILRRKGRLAYNAERNIDDPFAQARLQAAAAKPVPTSMAANPSDKGESSSSSKHKLNFKLSK